MILQPATAGRIRGGRGRCGGNLVNRTKPIAQDRTGRTRTRVSDTLTRLEWPAIVGPLRGARYFSRFRPRRLPPEEFCFQTEFLCFRGQRWNSAGHTDDAGTTHYYPKLPFSERNPRKTIANKGTL